LAILVEVFGAKGDDRMCAMIPDLLDPLLLIIKDTPLELQASKHKLFELLWWFLQMTTWAV
jgi:hypothetical protein